LSVFEDFMSSKILPETFQAVAIEEPGCSLSGLRIHLIAELRSDKSGEAVPVRLRTLPDANVFLGALLDDRNHLQNFLEIWVQTVGGYRQHYPEGQCRLTNPDLDRIWEERFEQFAKSQDVSSMSSIAERVASPPRFFSKNLKSETSGENLNGWRLCTEDDSLVSHGLSAYSASLSRYLFREIRKTAEDSGLRFEFLQVAGEPPEGEAAPMVGREIFEDCFVFNPEGGRLGFRQLPELSFRDYLGLIDGSGTRGSRAFAGGVAEENSRGPRREAQSREGFLFPHLGSEAQLAETLHLCLTLIRDLVAKVAESTLRSGRPFLNLRPDHLGISLPGGSRHTPYLWNRVLHLLDTGSAISVPVPGSVSEKFFVSSLHQESSIFWPGEAALVVRGNGTVRIREVTVNHVPTGLDAFVITGTLVTEEEIRTAKKDILHLRLAMGERTLELYATSIEPTSNPSEYRFRSFEQTHPGFSEILSGSELQLRQFPRSTFSLIPVQGSPSDLYSCGVMALQILFAPANQSLPHLVDEALSLARETHLSDHPASDTHGERLHRLILRNRSERWIKTFGLQNLAGWESRDSSGSGVPDELWWDIFALLLRFFPGNPGWSFCEDLSDFFPSAPATIYEKPIAELEVLCEQTLSLATGAWVGNSEIRGAIERSMSRQLGS